MRRTRVASFTVVAVFVLALALPGYALDGHECDISLPSSISVDSVSNGLWFRCPCEIMEIEIIIYNRWGQAVLEGGNIDSPFLLETPTADRKKKKTPQHESLQPGVYYYTVSYSVLVGDIMTEHKRQGTITMVR